MVKLLRLAKLSRKMCILVRALPWASMPEALGLYQKSKILNRISSSSTDP